MDSSEIGIIGSADGPTSIIVTQSFSMVTILGMAIVAVVIIGVIVWAVTRKNGR